MVARGQRVKRAQPLVQLRRAGIRGLSDTGGCALRAYPRLPSLHRFAVPAGRKMPSYFCADAKRLLIS